MTTPGDRPQQQDERPSVPVGDASQASENGVGCGTAQASGSFDDGAATAACC